MCLDMWIYYWICGYVFILKMIHQSQRTNKKKSLSDLREKKKKQALGKPVFIGQIEKDGLTKENDKESLLFVPCYAES